VSLRPFHRLYRCRLRTAVILSLPVLCLVSWLLVDTFIQLARARTIASSRGAGLTPELVRFYLKDQINRIRIAALAPEMPLEAEIPVVHLAIPAGSIDELDRGLLGPENERIEAMKVYKNAALRMDGGPTVPVEVHYVGENHWHWLYPQKSWRVKTPKSSLILGSRKINLKNPRSCLTYNEAISMDLAAELGLIAPRVFPIRMVLNSRYMGVYLWQDPIDESVIRRCRRMPGSVYAGDEAPRNPLTGVSALFENARYWEKSVSRNAEKEGDTRDIQLFLDVLNDADLLRFHDFAMQHINLYAYARFLSLCNITGCVHHDFAHNQRFYFDPITGRVEPIAWDVDIWPLESKALDSSLNPLLLKWKLIPELEHLRQETLYGLMNDEAFDPERMKERILAYDEKVRPSLEADIYRDSRAFQASRALKPHVLPLTVFDMEDYDADVRENLLGIDERHAFLREFFDAAAAGYGTGEVSGGVRIDVESDGEVAVRLEAIVLADDREGLRLLRDRNRNRELDAGDEELPVSRAPEEPRRILIGDVLYPGKRRGALAPGQNRVQHGECTLDPAPLVYSYFLMAKEGPVGISGLEGVNAITGKPVTFDFTADGVQETHGTISLHPWEIQRAPPETVVLGPGEVVFEETRVFPEHVSLEIVAGTEVLLGEAVSLYCHGKVTALGTDVDPIRFRPQGSAPWGTFALQGPGADGSRLEHCVFTDGSRAEKDLIEYSGAISFHDVDGLVLLACQFVRNHEGDDLVHLAYCKGAVVTDCRFLEARSDGLDVDCCADLRVTRSRFIGSGNDGLDFMTTTARVEACEFQECGDKGISVGEASDLLVESSVFWRCTIGIQIKDASVVRFEGNRMSECAVAIDLYKKNWRYGEGGTLNASRVQFDGCPEKIRLDKHSRATIRDERVQ